jgi:hypothetical protein
VNVPIHRKGKVAMPTTLHRYPTTIRALSQAAVLGIALLLSGCVLPFSTLNTPSGLYTTDITYSEIQVTWSGFDTSDVVLEVEHSTDGIAWTQVGLVNPGQSSFIDGNLDCGTTYFYRVRARSTNGVEQSGYSPVFSGTTEVCLPNVASPISPTSAVETPTPTFTWRAANSAESYRLTINGASGTVFEDDYRADEICVGDRCTATPDIELERGTYSWLVVAFDGAGNQTTSSTIRIDVDVPAPPTTPSLISPSGTVTTRTPTFTWDVVPGATWYYLQVNGADNTLIGQWYSALDVCPGEICALTVTRPIDNGTYTWSMQARNSMADSPFSSTQRFTIDAELAEPPGAASLIDPQGTVNTGQPTFRWDAVERATAYNLLIDGPEGPLIREAYSAQEICVGGTCSVTPEIALAELDYTWQIQAQNSYGDGPFSDPLAFTVNIPTPPPAPVPTSPSSQITAMLPRFYWNVAAEATDYQLQVYRGDDRVIDKTYSASAICDTSQCSALPEDVLLTQADYRWRVRGRNQNGDGPWSYYLTFNVFITDIPRVPDIFYPEGDITDRRPTYSWDAVDGADEYQIDVDGPSDTSFSRWYDADDVCSGNVCEVDPDETLDYDDYTWRVRARNEGGTSDWSEELDFEVIRGTPDTPRPRQPSGTVDDNTPQFRWDPADGAVDYQYYIREHNSHDEVHTSQWYHANAICDRDKCTVSLPDRDALSNGGYEWRVRARNDHATGDWSSYLDFTVDH